MSILAKGSSRPVKSSKVRLYGSRFDPYSAGIRYVMREKGLDYEDVYINTHDKPEWYEDINPTGEIPCLEYGDEIVAETLVIYDYLEEKFPEIKTQQTEAYKRSRDKLFIARCARFLTPKITGCVANPQENIQDVVKALSKVNEILGKRGTDYFGGSSPNYADYYLWGWLELLPVFKAVHNLTLDLDQQEYSHYFSWVFRMDKNAYVEKDRTERIVNFKIRVDFFKTMAAGKPDLTIGLEH
ncbi:Pyrimidodiazepine synthase [Trichoplax sp. H2]|nr:Pyrimidodiazepine synthase [Trichoplax sp. H2]|eukprot:RDD36483.1 Pyrimidodiazepine synthase [Trichoplax sp. H2]